MTIEPAVASRPGPYLYQPTTSTLGGTAKSPVSGSTPTGSTRAVSPSLSMRSVFGATVAFGAALAVVLCAGVAPARASSAGAPTGGGGWCVQAVTVAASATTPPTSTAHQPPSRRPCIRPGTGIGAG